MGKAESELEAGWLGMLEQDKFLGKGMVGAGWSKAGDQDWLGLGRVGQGTLGWQGGSRNG